MAKKLAALFAALVFLLLPAVSLASNTYIFPESDSKRLTYDEVWAWQYDALGFAFNELFARYGRPFEPGGKYDNYFSCQVWYESDAAYPGDGKVLSKLEWDNYTLIKQVRAEMRSRGTTNPKGKPLPKVFDDRVDSPLAGFREFTFKPNQSLKVYDGPGTQYRRGANGKAAASTNGRVYAAGWEDGWLMVMYQLNRGGIRVGFASPDDFTDKVNVPFLVFDRYETVTLKQAKLTEDPLMTLNTIGLLPEGSRLTWLTRYYTDGGAWDYVETTLGGRLCRGFLPYGIVDLGGLIDTDISE